MKRHTYIFKFVLPVLAAAIGLIVLYGEIDFYPLLFGVIIGIFNWPLHKYNPYLGIFLCVLVSYGIYGVSILSLAIYDPIQQLLSNTFGFPIGKDWIMEIGYIISPFVIAPLLLFMAVHFLFKTVKKRYALLIVFLTILILVVQAYFFFRATSVDHEEYGNVFVDYPYVIWVLIMILGIQLVLVEKKSNSPKRS